jgi:CheY-like chemotaxis protein
MVRIVVSAESLGGRVRIDVVDTGIGIPETAKDNIFDEYFQLDNPVRQRNKGLGLGLSIVKHIALLLDHELEVESKVGEGSRFSVWLPMVQAGSESPSQETLEVNTSTTLNAAKILLIEDDVAVLDSMKLLLELAGLRVYHATDAAAAMAQIEDGLRPQLLLTDYHLPDGDGKNVIHRIRLALREDLPALLMTGDTTAQTYSEGGDSVVNVLHKPVDGDDLLAHIAASLNVEATTL